MHFHILTLFPEMVLGGLNTSIIGRACEKGLLSLDAVNIRDYTENKHNKVDDYPYGGGAGMLMQAQPVFDAYAAVAAKGEGGGHPRVIYVTPQGSVFNQDMAREFAKEEELVFLCGHYEGIDERVLEEIVTDYVSIGDYVLTGGELPAMVMIDAISRMVPGVLKNEESGEFESFHENLLEYPQYTRPEVWHEKSVPAVLLSGDHAKVDKWRTERSIERTIERRPDLYEQYDLKGRALSYLLRDKLAHMDMIESIRRGLGEVIGLREDGVLLLDKTSVVYMVTAENKDAGERLLSLVEPRKAEESMFVCHQKFLAESVAARFGRKVQAEASQKETAETANQEAAAAGSTETCESRVVGRACYQAVYTRKTPLVAATDAKMPCAVRMLDESYAEVMAAHYDLIQEPEELKALLKSGMVYGAFLPFEANGAQKAENDAALPCNAGEAADDSREISQEMLAGFVGVHEEGGMGMLHVFEAFRRQGIAEALEQYLINRTLEAGQTPYAHIFTDNEASLNLQKKLGLKLCRKKIYWI